MPVTLNRAVSGGVDLENYVTKDTLTSPTPEILESLRDGLGITDLGEAADRRLTFTAPGAFAVWTINHQLGKYPSVVVVDSSGDEVEGDVHYDGLNSLSITFSAAIGGKAYLN